MLSSCESDDDGDPDDDETSALLAELTACKSTCIDIRSAEDHYVPRAPPSTVALRRKNAQCDSDTKDNANAEAIKRDRRSLALKGDGVTAFDILTAGFLGPLRLMAWGVAFVVAIILLAIINTYISHSAIVQDLQYINPQIAGINPQAMITLSANVSGMLVSGVSGGIQDVRQQSADVQENVVQQSPKVLRTLSTNRSSIMHRRRLSSDSAVQNRSQGLMPKAWLTLSANGSSTEFGRAPAGTKDSRPVARRCRSCLPWAFKQLVAKNLKNKGNIAETNQSNANRSYLQSSWRMAGQTSLKTHSVR